MPLSLAVSIDKKLLLLGAYVRFTKRFTYKRRRIAQVGTLGVIVSDVMGLCKDGQVAVKVPGLRSRHGYLPVSWKILDVQRIQR